MRKFDKRGIHWGQIFAGAMMVIVLLTAITIFLLFTKKDISILDIFQTRTNASAEIASKLWEEYTEEEKAKLSPEQQVLGKLEAAERALGEGQASNDISKLEKAKSLAQEILSTSTSEANKNKANDIIKAADASIARIKGENLLTKGREMASGGNKEDAIKSLDDCVNLYGDSVTGAECFAEKFFLVNTVNADNLVVFAEKYKADTLKQIQATGGNNKKKAFVLYASGLIYERGAILFSSKQGEFYRKSIENYNALKVQYPGEKQFVAAALLKIAMINENQFASLGLNENSGKRSALVAYQELYKMFKDDLGLKEIGIAKGKILELIRMGYADTLAVSTTLSGLVEDDDALWKFGPENAIFLDVKPDKVNELSNTKLLDVEKINYEMEIQFKIFFSDTKQRESGFDEVGEIITTNPLWLYIKVYSPITGETLCETRNQKEKEIRPISGQTLGCGNYVTFKIISISDYNDVIYIKMLVTFDYFKTYRNKLISGVPSVLRKV